MILVTGATGTIGRPLVEVLVNEGAEVCAVIRGTGPAGLPEGVTAVAAGLSHPETAALLLEGVTALFLHPRAVGLAAGGLLALARERGVQRAVALSAANVDDPLDQQPSRFRGDKNREVDARSGRGHFGRSLSALRCALVGSGESCARSCR